MIIRPRASRFSLLLAAALSLSAVASAGTTTTGARPHERRPASWAVQRTLQHGWEYVRGDLGGVWETLRSDERALALPIWSPVSLPHCFNAIDAVDPDTKYYQGPGWYRTQLDISNPHPNGRTLLLFEGAGQKVELWIGAQSVARHVGGYDEFVVDITDAVAAYRTSALVQLPPGEYRPAPGKIPLAVRCDNSRDLEAIPSNLSDFNLYGGLYRPVHLAYVPQDALTTLRATPQRQPDGTWQVTIRGSFAVNSPGTSQQDIALRIVGPDGDTIATATTSVSASVEMQTLATIKVPQPRLWSPASPTLYAVEATSTGPGGVSHPWERFGFRTFEFVEHGPFKLNGERLVLRGTHRHEDHAAVAAAMDEAQIEAEMRLMKSMGVNFIRLGHYQQTRRVLELCDELGLLVWEEIPWCRGGLGGARYREQARSMLRAMIDQHASHPSIIIWGLGNENDWPGDFSTFDQREIRTFMRELHELAHSLDPERMTAIRRCDFCRDIVDVYSPSVWAGWYRGQFTEYAASLHKEMLRVPRMLHAEWGGDSHAGRHAEDPYAPLRGVNAAGAVDERGLDFRAVGGDARASRDGDWSETYLCDLVDWHLKEQEKMDWLTGTAMWPFKDFSTPLRPDNPVPFMNQKGAVERDLTPKESFYVYQSYWSDQPMLHLYGHSWPVRWGKAGEKRWVKAYSNCDSVELWLNGVSQGVRRRDSQDYPAAGLRWQVPFEPGMNTLRAVGHRHGQTQHDEIVFRYETRAWGAKHHLRVQQLPAASGTVRIYAELLDAAGVVCLDARDVIRFGVTGDARLIDNLGTVGGSRVVQLANGRAQIDVKPSPDGNAMISTQVEGVPTALLKLDVKPSAATPRP